MQSYFTLVTGAAGFIGSRLTQMILNQGRNVIALDCFLPDLYDNQIKRRRWNNLVCEKESQLVKIEFDLRFDDFSILDKYGIVSIFNQAAMPGLQSDWGKFARYYECNLSGLNRLLEYSKNLNLNSFVQASTSSVYGKHAVGDESQVLKPTSPYGVSKLAAEKLVLAYLEEFAIPVKILRYFSVYGPHQRPDMAFSRIIESILNTRELTIFGDGEQRRSNTYIEDIVEATLLAENKAKIGDVMNICGNEVHSLNEAIKLIEEFCSKNLIIRREHPRKGDQRETFGSNALAFERLGWNPKVKFLEGLRNQVNSYLSDK